MKSSVYEFDSCIMLVIPKYDSPTVRDQHRKIALGLWAGGWLTAKVSHSRLLLIHRPFSSACVDSGQPSASDRKSEFAYSPNWPSTDLRCSAREGSLTPRPERVELEQVATWRLGRHSALASACIDRWHHAGRAQPAAPRSSRILDSRLSMPPW